MGISTLAKTAAANVVQGYLVMDSYNYNVLVETYDCNAEGLHVSTFAINSRSWATSVCEWSVKELSYFSDVRIWSICRHYVVS